MLQLKQLAHSDVSAPLPHLAKQHIARHQEGPREAIAGAFDVEPIASQVEVAEFVGRREPLSLARMQAIDDDDGKALVGGGAPSA